MMRFPLLAGCAIMIASLFGAPAQCGADSASGHFQNMWKKFSEVCDEASALIDSDEPQKRTAMEIITFRKPKYTRLLREARDILAESEAREQFEEIDSLRLRNRELEAELVDLRRARIAAPDSSYNPLKLTRERIDKKLAAIPREIADNNARIEALKSGILEILRASGLPLEANELDYFLISAEGDELLGLMAMAGNMKRIQKVIEAEIAADSGNVALARAYAGMYLVSLEAYAAAHEAAMANISDYRRKLLPIASEAKKNYQEAQRLKKLLPEEERGHLEANLKINSRTLEVAEMYDSLLQRRSGSLARAGSELKNRVDLARNTYRTLANGSNLIALVNNSSNEYALLINFEMPELKTIYDAAMLNAFMEIAEKIKNEK